MATVDWRTQLLFSSIIPCPVFVAPAYFSDTCTGFRLVPEVGHPSIDLAIYHLYFFDRRMRNVAFEDLQKLSANCTRVASRPNEIPRAETTFSR